MTTISISALGTLPSIGVVRQALAEAFAGDDPEIVLDAGELVEADFSIVQLLEAARRHAAAAGRDLRLATPTSAALTAVMARAGLTPDTAADPDFWFHGAPPQ